MENFSPALPLATGGPFSVLGGPLKSLTTTQLTSLSTAESAALIVALCTDCLSSSPDAVYGVGDVVFWNPLASAWVTLHDKVPATTDFLLWSLELARRGAGPIQTPFTSINGEFNLIGASGATGAQVWGYASGTGSLIGTCGGTTIALNQFESRTGTTSTGSFRAMTSPSSCGFTTAPVRKTASVMAYIPNSAAVSGSGTTFHWRFGVGIVTYSASAAAMLDEATFVYDDANTLGNGATGSELYAWCRINGTTFDWVATGVNPASSNKFLISAWEPEGPADGYGRFRLAVADSGAAGFTTLVDRRGTLGASTLSNGITGQIVSANTAGSTTRLLTRRFMRTISHRITNSTGSAVW